MQIEEKISIKPYNTFKINAKTKYFARFGTVDELNQLAGLDPILILGGGSNMLFVTDFPGIVAKNELYGIQLVREDDDNYYIQSAAGENWHGFVMHCLSEGYAGLENLSLIPGTVGASPIQNIGAYGVEIKDVFDSLEAYDLHEKKLRTFQHADCGFGYRDSVFKHAYKNRFVITSVTYRLPKKPQVKTAYGAISEELAKMGISDPTPRDVSNAVIRIRTSKLPDPSVIGNAGSFFKNPIVSNELFTAILHDHPTAPGYPSGADHTKLPAGWLIEQCGWKGYRKGDAGCYDKQALVLVNYGGATGKEIYALSEEIIASVADKFGVSLEREVNIFSY